jgi:hypothetical protein
MFFLGRSPRRLAAASGRAIAYMLRAPRSHTGSIPSARACGPPPPMYGRTSKHRSHASAHSAYGARFSQLNEILSST